MVNKINNNIKTVFILVSFLILCLFPNYSKSNTNYTLSTVTKVEPIFLSVKKNQPYEICKSVTVPITEYNDKVSPGDVIKGGIIGGIIGNNIPGEKNGGKIGAFIRAIIGAEKSKNSEKLVGSREEKHCHTEFSTKNQLIIKGYNIHYKDMNNNTGSIESLKPYKIGDKIEIIVTTYLE